MRFANILEQLNLKSPSPLERDLGRDPKKIPIARDFLNIILRVNDCDVGGCVPPQFSKILLG